MLGPILRAAPLALGLCPALAACASLPPPTPFHTAAEPRTARSVDVLIGVRQYGSDEWDDIGQPMVGGLETWWHRPDESLAWELTGQYAADDAEVGTNGKQTGRLAELSGGPRYLFRPLAKAFHPYVAAGGSVLWAELDQEAFGFPPSDQDAWGVGLYARAGIFAYLLDDIRLGVDVRAMEDQWMSEDGFDVGYVQAAVSIGANW